MPPERTFMVTIPRGRERNQNPAGGTGQKGRRPFRYIYLKISVGRLSDDDENWQVVSITSGIIKARILEGRLEAEGIPCGCNTSRSGKSTPSPWTVWRGGQILVAGAVAGTCRRVWQKSTAKKIWTGREVAK